MKTKGKDKVGIAIHAHCRVCNRPVPYGKEYCSPECREKEMKAEKRQKRMTRLWLISLVALMLFFLLSAMFRGA